jgi:preprotein translocase subunit SecD
LEALLRYGVLVLLLGFLGCSDPNRTTLEFRIAEDQPGPGLTEMVLPPQWESLYLHGEVLLDQSDVDSAFAITRERRPAITLVFTAVGARKLAELTEHNVGKRCGMILNGQLVSAPRIMGPIRGGRAVMAGEFSETEARRIARGLTDSKAR